MIGRSVALDPLLPLGNATLAQALVAQGDWDSALRQVQVTLDLIPDYWYALLAQRPGADGIRAPGGGARVLRAQRADLWRRTLCGRSAGKCAGPRRPARRGSPAARPPAHARRLAVRAGHGAGLRARESDERDEALALLYQAADAHDPWLLWGGCFPALDPLRSDLRFKAFRRRLGLPAV